MEKIQIWQEKLPYGEIFMELKVPWDIAQLEDATTITATAKIEEAPVVK
jgi:hypothetical protein